MLQQERLALLCRQLFECSVDCLPPAIIIYNFRAYFAIDCDIGQNRLSLRPLRCVRAAAVDQNAEDPVTEAARITADDRTVAAHERVLQCILGVRLVAQHARCVTAQLLAIPAHELLVRLGLAGEYAADQQLITLVPHKANTSLEPMKSQPSSGSTTGSLPM